MSAQGIHCRTCKHFGKMSTKCHGCNPISRINWEPKDPMAEPGKPMPEPKQNTVTEPNCDDCKHGPWGLSRARCMTCYHGARFEPKDPVADLDKAPEPKRDAGKLRPTLLPVRALEAVTEVREYGCRKYGDPENWRRVEPQRYLDALMRHLWAHQRGEATDPESGLSHLAHVACNAIFLVELEKETQCDAK